MEYGRTVFHFHFLLTGADCFYKTIKEVPTKNTGCCEFIENNKVHLKHTGTQSYDESTVSHDSYVIFVA